MARKCICQICKKKGDTDNFYKVTNEKGKSKYYCSKEEYDKQQQKIEKRYNLLKYIAEEVLDYEEGQIVPPVMVKRVQKLNEFYDFDVIHKCFKENKDNIQYWISAKNFENEYGMSSYVMRIIENTINDTYKKWKFEQKQRQQQENTNVDLDIINETTTMKTTVKADDGILNFLDEEDM